MRPMFILKFALLFLGLALNTLHAQDLSSMSDAQLRSTGVSKLSASEIAALQVWIDAQQKNPSIAPIAEAARRQDEPGSVNAAAIAPMTGASLSPSYPEPEIARPAAKRVAFDAALSAEITQLTGTSRIRLSNGQVWQQVNGETWRGSLNSLDVRLKPKFSGSWLMQFKANNMSIRVKRIE